MTLIPPPATCDAGPRRKLARYALRWSVGISLLALAGYAYFHRQQAQDAQDRLHKAREAWTALEHFRPSSGFYRAATEPEKRMKKHWYRHFRPPHPLSQSDCYYLGNSKIEDADLKHIVVSNDYYRPVTMVNLESTAIGNDGLAHLAKLPALTFLVLENTRVTDEGLPHLNSLKSLRWLSLVGTQVTKAGAEQLQSELPNCFIQFGPN